MLPINSHARANPKNPSARSCTLIYWSQSGCRTQHPRVARCTLCMYVNHRSAFVELVISLLIVVAVPDGSIGELAAAPTAECSFHSRRRHRLRRCELLRRQACADAASRRTGRSGLPVYRLSHHRIDLHSHAIFSHDRPLRLAASGRIGHPPRRCCFEHHPRLADLAGNVSSAVYSTGIVGKWHLGLGEKDSVDWNGDIKPGPLEVGFDYAYYYPATGDRVPCVYIENVGLMASIAKTR